MLRYRSPGCVNETSAGPYCVISQEAGEEARGYQEVMSVLCAAAGLCILSYIACSKVFK